jgi:hypothetical protein
MTQQQRKSALRKYKRTKSVRDKIELNRSSALARYAKRKYSKLHWIQFVSSLNTDTPMTKIWQRINKIRGTNYSVKPPSLLINGNIEIDPETVANELA